MNSRALGRATLARQALITRATDPLAMIERLVGLQAQQARPPFVGLWSRIESFQREQLSALLRDKAVVRATMMRGTLHLVTAADYVALRGALSPMFAAGVKSILGKRVEGLDVDKLCAFARTKLPATFDALRPVLAKKFPKFDDRALGYAVRMHLPLVQVPTEDRWAYPASSDFACAEAWLGRAIERHEPAVASALLVKRYLAAFGPATVRDAQTWSGLRDLAPAFAALRDELVTFRDGKRELFDLPDAPRPDADMPVPVRFLPDFDNLVLSHDDRSRVIAAAHRPAVVTKNLQVKATFLVDGVVAGTWTIERKKAATLVLSPFAALKKPVRAALEAEGDLLVRFVEPDAASYAIKIA